MLMANRSSRYQAIKYYDWVFWRGISLRLGVGAVFIQNSTDYIVVQVYGSRNVGCRCPKCNRKNGCVFIRTTLHYAITKKARHIGKNIRNIVIKFRHQRHLNMSWWYLRVWLIYSIVPVIESRRKTYGSRVSSEDWRNITALASLQLIQGLNSVHLKSLKLQLGVITQEQLQSCHQIFTLARQDFEYAQIWLKLVAAEGLEQLLLVWSTFISSKRVCGGLAVVYNL